MKNHDLVKLFSKMSGEEQETFIFGLRDARSRPMSNNIVKARREQRKDDENFESLLKSATPQQLEALLAKLGASPE